MTYRLSLGGLVILIASAAACYTGGDVTMQSPSKPAPVTTANSTEPSPASVTGVPCDVAQVLARDCASCHNTTPVGGAPNAMMTYDDLIAPSTTTASTDIATLSVKRMKDATNPMPPDGASAEDLAILAKWVADGKPMGSAVCDATPAASIYDTPSACTSNKNWTHGNIASVLMRPGGKCIECHDSTNGPSYYAAGTIFPTAHEPDDCDGTSSTGITVMIKDAAGKTYTAPVNAVGNFIFDSRAPIEMPYKAWVTKGGKTRTMSALQKDGDCNKCHTADGAKKAPGRIMSP